MVIAYDPFCMVDGTRTEYIEFIIFAEVLLTDSYIYIFSWTLVVPYLFILVNDLVWISMVRVK